VVDKVVDAPSLGETLARANAQWMGRYLGLFSATE
jgi:hypothetical protein